MRRGGKVSIFSTLGDIDRSCERLGGVSCLRQGESRGEVGGIRNYSKGEVLSFERSSYGRSDIYMMFY